MKYWSHFTDRASEAQRDSVISSRLFTLKIVKVGYLTPKPAPFHSAMPLRLLALIKELKPGRDGRLTE